MNYNFYILLLISIIISSPIIFLKNDILKKISITEEVILVSVGILTSVSILYFLYEKKSISDLRKITQSEIMPKLILYTLLITISILLGNYIVKSEGKVIRYKSFQRSLSLILLLILGHFVFGERVNKNTCLGIGIIIFGLYILDR
tara:strand:+ start:5071 stop:5508 length:438 start_codon:yes stop_codon:yes gene_type:complete